MSVAENLDVANLHTSDLLRQARERWPSWVDAEPVLGTVPGGLDALRGWLRDVDPAEADQVLLALVELGAVDGGDDRAAAAVVAWALLPAACVLAGRLTNLTPDIEQIIAGELWIQVRTFPWQRLHKVAANIVMNTRQRALQECGVASQVSRIDRTWAMTTPYDLTGDVNWEGLSSRSGMARRSARDELLDVLDWASDRDVITPDDRALLLGLVAAADQVDTVAVGRGWGGLMSNDVSAAVATHLGVSAVTVRRRARRSLQALRAATQPVVALCA